MKQWTITDTRTNERFEFDYYSEVMNFLLDREDEGDTGVEAGCYQICDMLTLDSFPV